MRNDLNSVIFEGVLKDDFSVDGEVFTAKEISRLQFTVKSVFRLGEEVMSVDMMVEARKRQAMAVFNGFQPGRGIRVVGRIANLGKPHNGIGLIAEHVELKPLFSNKPDVETNYAFIEEEQS